MKKALPKYWIYSLFRKIKLAVIHIYRAHGSPHEIALGAAIGAFWGVFPTFGLSTPLILILHRIAKFNVLTAFAGALVSNPVTSPFLLIFSYQIGTVFIKTSIAFSLEDWTQHLKELGIIMLIGATILSSAVAVLIYFITYYSILYRQRIKKM